MKCSHTGTWPPTPLPSRLEDRGRYVTGKGRRLAKTDFAYTTCPKCTKAPGHNDVVLFAQVAPA